MAEPARDDPSDGAALARAWLDSSPFVSELGIRLENMEPDRARLSMPFSDGLATMGNVVHGGAISSLIDTAAAAAAWSGAEVPDDVRASTIGVTVNFLAPARGQGLIAEARVTRRGREISFCSVAVIAEDGTAVAEGLVSYRL